ncbi:MAG: hypothetical protein Q9181_004177 [Wetmoreana brouardii]
MWPPKPQMVTRPSGSSQKSQESTRYIFDPLNDPRFKFPKHSHLIVCSSQGVYTYGSHGITEIFKSGSRGIVTAKRASTRFRILAVADDQIVILHDVRKGMRRSYRLKSADGLIRMLRYGKDPDRLFFTTTLQNAVQVYDLEHSVLLDPLNSHPSPPTVFALSTSSHLLLTASASPPVIQLTNLLLNTRPLLLRPQCSSAVVVVVEFHPERGNVFILGFADGTCAVYDAAYVFRDGGRDERGSGASGSGARWEMSHIKRLHSAGQAPPHTEEGSDLKPLGIEASDYTLANGQSVGITAAAFVPGQKTIVVTVGSDGRCCVVDFAPSEAHEAHLICTWQVASPPTCLSILSQSHEDDLALPIPGLRDYKPGHHTLIVAIGRQDGQVSFFDLNGNLLLAQTLAPPGVRIIDVAWMEGEDRPEPVPQQFARKRKSAGSKKSPGSVLAGHRSVAEEVVLGLPHEDEANTDILRRPAMGIESPRVTEVGALRRSESDTAIQRSPAYNHTDLPSQFKRIHPSRGKYESTSDTSASSSLNSMLRRLQFPIPPTNNISAGKPLQREGSRQLPRNNSWATEAQPRNDTSLKAYDDVTSSGADLYATQPSGKAAFRNSPSGRWSFAGRSSSEQKTTIGIKDLVPHTLRTRQGVSSNETATYDEAIWTDIAVDDGLTDEQHGLGLSDKENSSHAAVPITSSQRQAGDAPREDFTIHVDDHDRVNHPQPLSAHPRTSPTLGRIPPAPAYVNMSLQSSALRAPFSRQRYKKGNGESHRSSVYGPGALAKRVQQAVMITVNMELEILRREMDEKFANQQAWCVSVIKDSQIWTLRVEEENRRLREELAKERKRREGDRLAKGGC